MSQPVLARFVDQPVAKGRNLWVLCILGAADDMIGQAAVQHQAERRNKPPLAQILYHRVKCPYGRTMNG